MCRSDPNMTPTSLHTHTHTRHSHTPFTQDPDTGASYLWDATSGRKTWVQAFPTARPDAAAQATSTPADVADPSSSGSALSAQERQQSADLESATFASSNPMHNSVEMTRMHSGGKKHDSVAFGSVWSEPGVSGYGAKVRDATGPLLGTTLLAVGKEPAWTQLLFEQLCSHKSVGKTFVRCIQLCSRCIPLHSLLYSAFAAAAAFPYICCIYSALTNLLPLNIGVVPSPSGRCA